MADLGIITLSRTTEYVARLLDCMPVALRMEGADALDVLHIVVNNSNDPKLTAAAIKRGALVMEPGYNTTFSEGNNLAAGAMKDVQWLLLLNDDLLPEPGFVHRLWRNRADCDVCGSLLVHTDNTVNHAGTIVLPRMTDHLGRGQARKDWESKEAAYCDAVTFAAALIKRDTWDFLGGLDEAYRYGWEDTDFCMRVLEAGGAIKCARDAVALHDECGTRPRGGQNDSTNYQLFTSRWEAKIPALLTAYHQRMA